MFKDIGIDLISHANNHALDWGVEGMLASDQVYDAIGLVHAGTGASLEAARAPSFFNAGKVRIALVAAASTFPGMSPAGNPTRGAGPRPGLNPLHTKLVTCVTKGELPALQSIAIRGGWQGFDLPTNPNSSAFIGETEYRLCERPGISYQVSSEDEQALRNSVAAAARDSGLVLFSIHAHETMSGGYDDPQPADFLPPLFHSLIDSGADIVVRHGPHIPLAIEIYKDRPIFYGMASLFFDLPAQLTVASEGPEQAKQVVKLPRGWWDSMIATIQIHDGKLTAVTIYPIVIEPSEGDQRGIPHLASGAEAMRILELVRKRSAEFGTNIVIRGDVGTVALPGGS
jgi:poly-gamma-glutamate synthesis protein (capsule biosynthesis protein)